MINVYVVICKDNFSKETDILGVFADRLSAQSYIDSLNDNDEYSEFFEDFCGRTYQFLWYPVLTVAAEEV